MSKQRAKTSKVQNECYRDSLEPVEKARYFEKLKLIGGIDPYESDLKSFSDDKKLLPTVTYPDIVNYLLFSPSPYTKDDLKALKSLDAYNQALSGWVSDVRASVIGGLHVIRSKVLHSMRLREKPLQPWSIVEQDGVIRASHCNCMAGLGEVCSHVAAMLFTVMEVVRIRDTQTVTQDPAYWKYPASVKTIEYKEVKNIDFTSAKSLKRKFDAVLASDAPMKSTNSAQTTNSKKVPEPTNEEVSEFLQNLHNTGKKAALLSVVEKYCDEYVPAVEKLKMPTVLTELKQTDAFGMNYSQLVQTCEDVTLTVSNEEVKNVETLTRDQSNCRLWYTFRAGRITASNMKSVCATDPANPSQSMTMSICYPESKRFTNNAVQWGKSNEKVAIKQFQQTLCKSHGNVQVEDCGLFICEDKPYIAASPDGIVTCDCCEPKLLEVKCPFNQRKCQLDETLGNFYLKRKADGTMTLDKSHQYFYQVQTQLGATGYKSAYFVVMTEVDLHIEEIKFDADLWDSMCKASQKIFIVAILPELVGKFYSRLPGSGLPMPVTKNALKEANLSCDNISSTSDSALDDERFCYCNKGEFGEMIACDNENCVYKWFHFPCLKLEAPPKSKKWFCPDCRKLPEFSKLGKKSRK